MGCYTYRPLAAPVPAQDTRVAVALTDDGAQSLAGRVGPNISTVEGDVLRADSAQVVLAVREVENGRGERSDWRGETVEIPRSYVRDFQERRLSVGGTGMLGGAVIAGLVAAYELLGGSGIVEGPNTGGGGGDQ